MADWKSKKLDRIDSAGLSSASKPYKDGNYWCVTVRVSYDHIYAYVPGAKKDALSRKLSENSRNHPGKRGVQNAILEGLQSLGRAFLAGPNWAQYYENQILPDLNEIDPLLPGQTQSPNTENLKEKHLLFKGPVIDTRPYGRFARYQIGIHELLLSHAATIAGFTGTIDLFGGKTPPLSLYNSARNIQDLQNIAKQEGTESWPKLWRQSNTAKTELSKFVLGAKWNPEAPGESSLIKPYEFKYNNFQDFEKQVETLALHLTLRQEEHENLKNQRFFYKDTDTILNFNNYAEVLRDCARQVKSFLLFNEISLTQDEIAFGWYPHIPNPTLSNPEYNPDRSHLNFATGQGVTHIVANKSKLYSMPDPADIAADDPEAVAQIDPAYIILEVPEGSYVREIEKYRPPVVLESDSDGEAEIEQMQWLRVRVIEYTPNQEGLPAPHDGVTGWIPEEILNVYQPPDKTELQNYQSILEASGYLAYIRCPKKSSLDTARSADSPAPSKKLQPIKKIKREKLGNELESDTRFMKKLNFHWIGFSAFLETPGFRDRTVANFFKSMNSINNRPGNDYDSLHFQACRGFAKPGASGADRLPLVGSQKKRGFVDTYVLENFERRPYEIPNDASAIVKYFDSFKNDNIFASTPEDVREFRELTAGKGLRYAVANRSRGWQDQVGDALFAAMPSNVDKVRSWSDLYAYVLNRVDIPTIFYKLMDCIGPNVSLDDLVHYLCDAFLREIGSSPEEVDRFFAIMEEKIIDASTIETGLGDRYNIELVDPYQLMQDIKTSMAEKAAESLGPAYAGFGEEEITALEQGDNPETNVLKTVDDQAFYEAAIAAIGDNPNNRYFLCELIMAGMFSLGALLLQLANAEKDIDPVDADNAARKLKEAGAGIGKACALPWLNLPDAITVVDKWLASLLRQLEEKLYQYIEEKVFAPANEALIKLATCGEDDDNYGLIPLEDLLPRGPEDPELSKKMGPLGIDDPKDFLSALVAMLTPLEICSLLDGAPRGDTLIAIKSFMQSNYQESYSLLDSDIKIITFFQDLRSFFDTSACFEDYPSNGMLKDFCHDGETNRHAAIRASLTQKGLTEEEIDAQIEIDKELTRQQVLNIVQVATLGQGKEDPLKSESTESNSFISEIMAASESTSRQSTYAIKTILEPINNAFVLDLGTFIPSLFSEIIKLRNMGLNIDRLPFYELLRGAYNPNYESTYYNMDAGLNFMYMWSPRIDFIPGKIDMVPTSPTFLKYLPDTAKLKMLGVKYGRTQKNPGNANIKYEILPPAPGRKLDVYNFRLDGRTEADTNSGFISTKKMNLIEVRNSPPNNLGEFANIFLQDSGVIDLLKKEDLPYQVSLFKAFLAWSLTRATYATSLTFPSYSTVYGSSKDLNLPGTSPLMVGKRHQSATSSPYFKIADKNIQYNNRLVTGAIKNVDMISVIYDQIVESYNKKIAEITSNSDLFDISRLAEISIYDSEDSSGLLEIKKLAQETSDRAKQLMRRIDFQAGEDPTHISDAMFEGLIKAFVKLYVVEMVMSCVFMFSRFRPGDALSDDLVAKFIKDRIEEVTFPDGTNIRERHAQFLYNQETKLRKFMSERDSLVIPSEEEIDNRVKKEIYKGKNTAAGTYDALLKGAISSNGSAGEVRKVLEEVLGSTLDPLEEEVLLYEAAGEEDPGVESVEVGTYPKPVIDEIIVEASDVNWHGLEDPYRWAHKIWVWEGSHFNETTKEWIAQDNFELKKGVLRKFFKDNDKAWADADEPGAESFGNFKKIMPEKATTTCLRQLLPYNLDNAKSIPSSQGPEMAWPVEIPVGLDLKQGGTTFHPGKSPMLTYPLNPPITKNVGIISSLNEGWDIEISFEYHHFQNMADNTPVTEEAIDMFQEKLLTEYGLVNINLPDLENLPQWGPLVTLALNTGFVEAALGYRYPPENWSPSQGSPDGLPAWGWVDETVLSEHDWQITSTEFINRKAKFRVRSAPALTATYDENAEYAYRGKLNGGFYRQNILGIKSVQLDPKDWYPYKHPQGAIHGFLGPEETVDINGVPKIDKEFSEHDFVTQHISTNFGNVTKGGLQHSGLNRYRVKKMPVRVPTRIIVEEYTGVSSTDGTPEKGVMPSYRLEYDLKWVNVLQEIISEYPVMQGGATWKANAAATGGGGTPHNADLVAGFVGPQQKEAWQALDASGAKKSFEPNPMIQIRPPVYWFNEDVHLGNPLKDGSDQEHEIFVPEVKNFKLNIKGSNFDGKIKAYLQPRFGPGPVYPFNVEVISDEELKLEMPLQVYLGDRMFDADGHHGESIPDWWVPGWQNSKAPHGEFEDQTGDILTMAGLPVLTDTYVLVLDNHGEREVGNVYFTTFNDHHKLWNDMFFVNDSKGQPLFKPWAYNWPPPILPDRSVAFPDDIDASAPTTAFNLPVYPIQTNEGVYSPETWDVVDVATITGAKYRREPAALSEDDAPSLRASKELFLCEPRIDTEKYRSGGFILEKYVRIKFRSKAELEATNEAVLNELVSILYDSVEKDYTEAVSGTDSLQEDIDPEDPWTYGSIGHRDLSQVQIASKSLINGLSIDNGKCNDIIMSYSSFTRLLKSLSGGGNMTAPVEIGRVNSITGGHKDLRELMATILHNKSSLIPSFVPWKRICIDKPDWTHELNVKDHPYSDIIGAKVWKDMNEFIEFDRAINPQSIYEIEPFDIEPISFPGLPEIGSANLTGYIIKRSDPIEQSENDYALAHDAVANTPWQRILEDVAFGLRLSYVLPEVKGTKKYPNHYPTAFEPRYNYLEGIEAIGGDPHRLSIDDEIRNRLNPWTWTYTQENFDEIVEGSLDKSQVKLYKNGKFTSVLSKKYKHNNDKTIHCYKTNHLHESGLDPFGEGTVSKEVFFFPIVSVEIDSSSAYWPTQLNGATMVDLERAYPEAKPTDGSLIRKNMYRDLYKKLRTDSKFKLLFEYLIQSKRILGLNAIYNMMNFEQFFTDECTFPSIFSSTKTLLKNTIVLTQDNPAGEKVDGDDVPVFPDIQEKVKGMNMTKVSKTLACPPNIKALADHINKGKL